MSKHIVLTGGGTGGHITPLIAVAHELKLLDPSCRVTYIGERNGRFTELLSNNRDIDEILTIYAGKFRRYHRESWLKRAIDAKTHVLNLRDTVYVIIGFVQALRYLQKLRPDMILLKGGFVGVPVGIAAALLRQPYMTHDSDVVPGLANRVVSRWARYHATGMPAHYYTYPKDSIRHVGVIVGNEYKHVSHKDLISLKDKLGMKHDTQMLLVTGGSNGAAAINRAMKKIISLVLDRYPKLHVVHQVGKGNMRLYGDFSNDRLTIYELLSPMYIYTGAADLVVTRAGANTIAELGTQGKPCIVIPNPLLTAGHQLKNAELWSEQRAVVALDEERINSDPSVLFVAINELLENPAKRAELSAHIEKITVKNAAKKVASLLIES